jgi:hypothetical protein
MMQRTKACRVLVQKTEGSKPLERSWSRWDDNIKMDLKVMRFEGVDWSHLAQDRDKWWADGYAQNL